MMLRFVRGGAIACAIRAPAHAYCGTQYGMGRHDGLAIRATKARQGAYQKGAYIGNVFWRSHVATSSVRCGASV